jgi:hypothetical protein
MDLMNIRIVDRPFPQVLSRTEKLASLVGLIVILSVGGPASAGELVCSEGVDLEATLAAPRWVPDALDRLQLHADLPQGYAYTVDVRARLGPLKHEWSEGPFDVDDEGALVVSIHPPDGAFLDVLAIDYVTGLRVRVVGRDKAGTEHLIVSAPAAFLAWPDGRGAGSVLWDASRMATEAPLGIVDDALRDQADNGLVDRILPPIRYAEPPPPDDTYKEQDG